MNGNLNHCKLNESSLLKQQKMWGARDEQKQHRKFSKNYLRQFNRLQFFYDVALYKLLASFHLEVLCCAWIAYSLCERYILLIL